MILTKWQRQVGADTHRFRVICAGRRIGKTTLSVEEIKGFALSKETRIAYIAPTFAQARDIAWAMLIKELKPLIQRVNETRLELEIKNIQGTASYIYLRGWEAIETLRGQKFDFIIIDEVASMRSFWMNWHEVVRPTLTDTEGQAMFISTPKGFNHFYDLYNLQEKDIDYISYKFTTYDNPHIPKKEIDKAKEELPEDRFAQEYLADFRKTQGLVYPEFKREIHVTPEDPNNVIDTVAGIDWGYSNPASSHRVRVTADKHYWIDSEFYKTGQTTEQIIENVKLKNPTKVYPDPAEPDRLEMARRLGLNVREVSKDIKAGIDSVRELLKQGRIHIHPECKNLISEFETYRYPEKKPNTNENELPIKENDHALDEIRYVLHNQEPKKEINPDPVFETYGTHYVV
jgi:PBSX family phage terminase large subunit